MTQKVIALLIGISLCTAPINNINAKVDFNDIKNHFYSNKNGYYIVGGILTFLALSRTVIAIAHQKMESDELKESEARERRRENRRASGSSAGSQNQNNGSDSSNSSAGSYSSLSEASIATSTSSSVMATAPAAGGSDTTSSAAASLPWSSSSSSSRAPLAAHAGRDTRGLFIQQQSRVFEQGKQ